MAASESKTFNLITSGLASRDRDEKLLALRALGILAVPEHADLVIDQLGSPDQFIVMQALEALSSIGNPKAVKYVLEFLHSENHTLADKALEVLSRFKLDTVLEVVLKAAGPEHPPHLRKRLLSLLQEIKDPRVAAFMCEVIGQTKDTSLLIEATSYFIRFPSQDRATILRMLSSNAAWEISLLANVALSRLGDEGARTQWKRLLKSPAQPIRLFLLEALNLSPMPADREVYEALFQDSHPQVRAGALKSLRLFPLEERTRILRDWVAREREEGVRTELLKVVQHEKNPAFFGEFFALLSSSSESQKKVGIAGLSGMGGAILDRILAEIPKMSLVVKEKILLVLGHIGGERACKAVIPFLDSPERWLRINAIEALATMKASAALPRLVALLERETDIWVKATLLSGLSRLGTAAQAPQFLDHLAAKDPRVRANAIQGLWQVGSGDHAAVLQPLLRDPNDRVRVNAAVALWKTGDRQVLGNLVTMTREGSKWVRASAAFALGEIGDKEATPALLSLLNDSDDVVYRNALDAIAKIGDLRALIPLLRETDRKRIPEATLEFLLTTFARKLHR